MTSRPSTAAPILAVLAVVLATLGAYVGGYLWLGQCSISYPHGDPDLPFDRIERGYPQRWMVTAFKPVSLVEASLFGYPVHLWYEEPEQLLIHPAMATELREGEDH